MKFHLMTFMVDILFINFETGKKSIYFSIFGYKPSIVVSSKKCVAKKVNA